MKQYERIIDYLDSAAKNYQLDLLLFPVRIVKENGDLLAEYPNAHAIKYCHLRLSFSSFEINPDYVLVFHLDI